jgi:hypothetical protein
MRRLLIEQNQFGNHRCDAYANFSRTSLQSPSRGFIDFDSSRRLIHRAR